MANNYASTSQRPKLNGSRPSVGPVSRTKVLLIGLRRAGKTSIQQVLFNNLPPNQTFYLESTIRITKIPIDTVIPLEIWDCPGNITVESLGVPLSQFSTIIFVIDIRDLYNQPISKLVEFIVASYEQNPEIILEVFVHKAEKLQDDDKIENFRQIHERVSDRLLDISPEYEQMQLNFHLTSVYDHSLHEAFSRVLHKLIESLPFLEELLNVFCANSQSPKAFLFDTRSRLYVATDASPVDSATHNLCCDYLLMLNSFGPLYKSITASPTRQRQLKVPDVPNTPPPSTTSSSPLSSARTHSISSSNSHSPGLPLKNGSSSDLLAPPPAHTNGGAREHPVSTPTNHFASTPTLISSHMLPARAPKPHNIKHRELFYPSASTTLSTPSSPSGGTTTLTYHLITKNLALLALIPSAVYEERRGLLEYNVVFFREGVQEICDVEEEARVAG